MQTIHKIKSILASRNITQQQLARELGVSYHVLNGVINNRIKSLRTEIKLIEWVRSVDTVRSTAAGTDA